MSETVIGKVHDILKWFHTKTDQMSDQLKEGNIDPMLLSDLVKARQRLALYSFELADFTGDLYRERMATEWERKSEQRKKQEVYFQETNNASSSKLRAEGDIKVISLGNAAVTADANWYKAQLLLKQVNEVLNAMASSIKYLESEYRKSNY